MDLTDKRCLKDLIVNFDDAGCPGIECCNNKFLISKELLELLTLLTKRLDKKLYIRFLFKCNEYNRKIGGGNNNHALGISADIDTIRSCIEPVYLAQLAWEMGFNAVGVYGSNSELGYKRKKGMVHIGIEPVRKHWGDWSPIQNTLP
jgi:hypothetical protein